MTLVRGNHARRIGLLKLFKRAARDPLHLLVSVRHLATRLLQQQHANNMEQLRCVVQNYAWGKVGRESRVAQLMRGSDASFHVDENAPYAELWMGTHPNGSAWITRDGADAEPVSEWLKNHPDAAGETSSNGELPFLFKVLSVGKALSIQAHPDIELARTLHAKFPSIYKDPNHKPEMAIALTRFEALCQFRPLKEIAANLERIPELRSVATEEAALYLVQERDEKALRAFFRAFIHADSETITAQITKIQRRLESLSPSELEEVDALVLRLIGQYGHDIGCFCPYLLNYITLQPGEAVFLGANEPHAYLFGDCVECMACSDNVVRAGLTPKFIDKETLSEMLTYHTGRPRILSGDRLDDAIRLYSPPIPEFEIEVLSIASTRQASLTIRKGASVILVTSGSGRARHPVQAKTFQLRPGTVYLIGANERVEVETAEDSEGPLVAYRAFSNESI